MMAGRKTHGMERKNMFAGLMRGRCLGFGMACILGLLLVQSCNPPESPAQRSQRRFRFIFANDIHFRGEKDAVMLAKIINEWKTEVQQWDFAVVAGDLTNHGNIDKMKLLKEHLDKIGKPYYPVIGNSDITAPGDSGKKNYFAVFGEHRGDYLVVHKNVVLIFLDLSNDDKKQVEVLVSTKLWLKKMLAFVPTTTPIIVFSHYPLHPESPRFGVFNSIELFRLFDDHNVLAYFSGHYHARWSGYRNGVPFFTNARLLPNWKIGDKYPGSGYMIVDVYKSTVGVSYKETEYGETKTRVDEGERGTD